KGKYTALNLEEICKEPIEEVKKVVDRMETMSIKSFINLPIVVGESFMGFIGFHDCENIRYWDKREIENFKMTGEVLGNAIYRKIGDQKLRKSQLKYHTITEISPVGIFQTDRRGGVIYVNKRWTEMSGLVEEEALGDKWTKALSQEDREEVLVNWMKFVKKPTIPFEQEFRFKRSDNHLVWLLAQANPEYDINNRLIGYIGTLTDITAAKKIQRDREILLEELKIKNKELQQFTYTVSHDLKSPLITIKGFLGILEEDIRNGLTTEINKDLSHISKAADKMGDLLKGILRVSRTQQTSLNIKKVDSLKLIREAISLLEGQMLDKDIRINLEGDFPALLIDKTKMFEVFQNLIDNAIKYMGQQDAPKIDIGYRRYDQEHLFHVRDNGIGIDERFREKIFGLFDRLDTTIDGTGIGLTIVQRIINQHEGRIWIESGGLGKGSTFFFTLPAN
ncbi:MAG: ATP-binding protein, partial [Bacteroidota bacterium]